MVILAVVGTLLIVVLAVVVGFVENAQAPRWREVAAERRRAWEQGIPYDDEHPTGPRPLSGRR